MSKYVIYRDYDTDRYEFSRNDNELNNPYEIDDALVDEYDVAWNNVHLLNARIANIMDRQEQARRRARQVPLCYRRHPDAKYDIPPELASRIDFVDNVPTARVIIIGEHVGTAIATDLHEQREGITKPCRVMLVVMGITINP